MVRVSIPPNSFLRRNPKSVQIRVRSFSLQEKTQQQTDNHLESSSHSRIVEENSSLMKNPQIQSPRVCSIAGEVSKFIRTRSKWEPTLSTEFPDVNFSDPNVYNAVLRQEIDASLSFRFYSWLRSIDVAEFDSDFCNIVFSRLLDANAVNAARDFLNKAKFEPEPQHLETYIRSLCKNSLIDEALVVFEWLRSIGYNVSLGTWNSVLLDSVRSKKIDIVWKLYGEMTESGVVADVKTIGCLIRAFCLDNNPGKGYKLFRQILAAGHVPENVVFKHLVSALCRNRSYGKVQAVLHAMVAKNQAPDVYTYRKLIVGLCDGGMVDDGFRIFNELRTRGYSLDIVMYTTMIRGLCRNKNLGDARKLWSEMIDGGIAPNDYSYNVLIDGLFKNGDIDEAEKLYGEMLDGGCGGTAVTYTTMINGLCSNGKLGEARRMFDSMDENGVERDSVTYNAMLKGYFRGHNVSEEGVNFLNEVLSRGFRPTTASIALVIEKLCDDGFATEAERLWLGMEGRGGFEMPIRSMDSIAAGLGKEGLLQEGVRWLGHMICKGIRPKIGRFEDVFERMFEGGKIGDGEFVLGYALKMGFCSLETLAAIVR
ncbi:pentatricopeptide repeat-containing protein At5g18950 [Andrographis paniculata]|uniref:pentatricopeptide repeat-containing protein At5g18950 n=1 Tax=Andrographis paniculata TaxID=175694 RepID=UPI0021E91087|nr:pentatricopeptide repeat-containing protein At5g18950 [Andrographis paniculata]